LYESENSFNAKHLLIGWVEQQKTYRRILKMRHYRLALSTVLSLSVAPVIAQDYLKAFEPVNVTAEQNVLDKIAESVKALPVAVPAAAPITEPVEDAPSFRDVFKPVAEPVAEPVEATTNPLDAFKPVAEEPSAALTPVTLSAYQSGLAAAKAGDFIKANEEWAPLAETGNPRTQYHLGVKFQNGIGLPQDDKEAVKWFQLAAEQGLAKAQYNLGIMYFKGRGVIQHYKEAVKWYRLAAEQGLAEAQSNLGFMHEKGQGVPQDNAIAHMWFNIASANGNSKSGEWRDERAGLMTQADISKAQAKARECMSSGYTKCGY
jgi:hypothetical protein